jgi:hypothetical protein
MILTEAEIWIYLSYCKRWSPELKAILIWISIRNMWVVVYDYKCNLAIAMCASFLKAFVWCKFGSRWLNVPRWPFNPIAIHFVNNEMISLNRWTRCYCIVNYLFIMQHRWPLSSIVIGYANFGIIKCRLMTLKFNSY